MDGGSLVIGALAISSISLVPQVYKAHETKSARDLSYGTIALVLFSGVLVLMHGLYEKDGVVITIGIVSLVVCLALAFTKYRFERSLTRMADIDSKISDRTLEL